MNNFLESRTYVLEKFLTQSEIDGLKQKLFQNFFISTEKNTYLPYRYPDIDWNTIDSFNLKSAQFKQNLNIEEILIKRLREAFLQNHFVSLGSLVKEGIKFNPYTVRVLLPGKVDIHHHVENQAIPHYPVFFGELNKLIEVMNQLSFVLMIQKPTSGGEIILFKDRWQGTEKIESQRARLDNLDNNNLIEEEIENKLSLEEGDLLIFPAGETWHKVSEVFGDIPRITLGGFMGKLKTDSYSYGFWS